MPGHLNAAPAERLPDNVMLDDFERLLEMGESDPDANDMAAFFELAKFIDEHGRRLLLLARTCDAAMQRQSREPT